MNTKILFVITTMGGGGAERIISYLSNYFCQKDNTEVSLLLLKEEGNTYIDQLSKKVQIYNLNLKGRLRWNVLKIVRSISKIRPNICFIGLDGLNILLAPFVPYFKSVGIRMIVRETNVLSSMWGNSHIKKIPYRLFYNNYNNIICQSKDMADDLIKNWAIRHKKITIINNPVDTATIREKSDEPITNGINLTPEYFVSVGRLSPQKGFDRLIKLIHQLVRQSLFPYRLLIIGDGADKIKLKNLIRSLQLDDIVILLGRLDNPYQITKHAKGFILSSYFEGFPNVLLEANALGVPILANNCPGGINEIIIEHQNGYVADFDSFESFKNKFIEFCNTPFDSDSIKELNYNRYDRSVIFPMYSKLFSIQ